MVNTKLIKNSDGLIVLSFVNVVKERLINKNMFFLDFENVQVKLCSLVMCGE